MLVREQEQIIRTISQAYDKFRVEETAAIMAARSKVSEDFLKDARVVAVAKALEANLGLGAAQAQSQAWALATNTKSPVQVDFQAAIKALPTAKLPYFNNTPAGGELAIALAACGKKWPGIQTAVYGLMADLSTVKKVEDIDTVVRTFTKAIA